MTFKHIGFYSSPTMRSLERLAIDKGLIKTDPLEKIASKKDNDLSATKSLTENVMKLCSGLRSEGLEKYAEEIETHFMIYKKAEHLYETSKETGEDLVDQAHPKGSHKLEGVEGDSLIETVIKQQEEDLKIVNKKPTGKLSNAKKIINAVKMIAAQDNTYQDEEAKRTSERPSKYSPEKFAQFRQYYAKALLEQVLNDMTNVKSLLVNFKPESSLYKQINTNMQDVFNIVKTTPPASLSDEVIAKISNRLDSMESLWEFDWFDAALGAGTLELLFAGPLAVAPAFVGVARKGTEAYDRAFGLYSNTRKNILRHVSNSKSRVHNVSLMLGGSMDNQVEKWIDQEAEKQKVQKQQQEQSSGILNGVVDVYDDVAGLLAKIETEVNSYTDEASKKNANNYVWKVRAQLQPIYTQIQSYEQNKNITDVAAQQLISKLQTIKTPLNGYAKSLNIA